MKKRIAILHHNDPDGFGAAFAAWCGLHNTCELMFVEVQYGKMIPYASIRKFWPDEIHILDFSYCAGILHELEDEFGCVVIIDHHESAENDVEEFHYSCKSNRSVGIFDNNMSGAGLAWLYYNPTANMPYIIKYVQDRDLWRFEMTKSREINAYIATLPKDFNAWLRFNLNDAVSAGTAVLSFQSQQVLARMSDVVMVKFEDYVVPCVNASENVSELGNAMCAAYPDAPFTISYCDRSDGWRSYSLRSTSFDVGSLAKQYGGGGHRLAAGFHLPTPQRI